jgi:5,10-methylenetetrahydromethanopterin reductase
MPPRVGIRLLDDLGSPQELVRLACAAEEAGFDTVWFPHDTLRSNSWVLAAATAQATQRVEVCTVGTNPWATHVSEIATFLGTLDRLSAGRAVLGLGVHTYEMLGWVGIDVEAPLETMRQSVGTLRALLRGDSVATEAHLRFPLARAEPPIYICAFGEEFLELSGEIGDGSLPMVTPPESASLMVDRIHRGARRVGRDPQSVDIAGLAWISVAEDGSVARERMAEIAAYFGAYLEEEALAAIGLHPSEYLPARERIMQGDAASARRAISDDMLRLGIAGTPEQCVQPIKAMLDAGLTQVVLGGPLGPDPGDAIRLIGERVLPALR